MSLVKRGYGYGGYGYGHSKPQMNYNRQNCDSVTTVVTDISRMTVNEKPSYGAGAGAMQKHAFLEEVCEDDDDGVYSGHHGGAVQKHDYQKEIYQHGAATAVQKHGYGQEAYKRGTGDVGGYDALHHDASAQKQYSYGQKAYKHGAGGVGGYDALHHGGETGGLGLHRNQATYGKAYKHELAGGHQGGALTYQYKQEYESEDESDWSEESGDESDSGEEFAHGGQHHDGSVHRYDAYKREEKHAGSNKLSGARHYVAYERRQGPGGWSHYESYERTTITDGGYSGGGYGGFAQRKNHCLV